MPPPSSAVGLLQLRDERAAMRARRMANNLNAWPQKARARQRARARWRPVIFAYQTARSHNERKHQGDANERRRYEQMQLLLFVLFGSSLWSSAFVLASKFKLTISARFQIFALRAARRAHNTVK